MKSASRFPPSSYASSAERQRRPLVRTINRQIPQRRARRPLHLHIMTIQQKQNRLERLARDFLDVLLGYFGECERGGTLQVDVVGVGEG